MRPAALRLGRRAFGLSTLVTLGAQALGRIPYGGALRLWVPFALSEIDPHELGDEASALFATAVSDPLYALDSLGRPYPALGRALPEPSQKGAIVRLRPGLMTARGKKLEARDVIVSLARARRRGGAGLVSDLSPRAIAGDALALEFPGADPAELPRTLASPVLAILPRDFRPQAPDGTGAFAAVLKSGRLELSRNPNAARGPAFLDRIEVTEGRDLAEGLRAFETGAADVGWLGSGLYRARGQARPFRGRAYGFAILRTGKRVRGWSAPGVAQRLLDEVPPERLSHLGLQGLPRSSVSGAGWGGGNAEILASDRAPQLSLLARTLAAALSRPGHPLTVRLVSPGELTGQKKTGDFSLMTDFVGSLGPTEELLHLSLLTAQDPALAKKPPRLGGRPLRELCRGLTLGVAGELWVAGAHDARFHGLDGFRLGDAWREREEE